MNAIRLNQTRLYFLCLMGAAAILASSASPVWATSSTTAISGASGLTFDLPAQPATVPPVSPSPSSSGELHPLPVPPTGTAPPVGKASANNAVRELPPPPTPPLPSPPADRIADSPPSPEKPLAITFNPEGGPSTLQPEGGPPTSDPSATPKPPPASPSDPSPANALPSDFEWLFAGDTHSLVARAIGSAEGTRTPNGAKTRAFKGHVDPGNGVWNLGTFSYQHGASSPQEADRKQLARLRQQAQQLQERAIAHQVPWGLEEKLNALDLANQSPLAALGRGGYIVRLRQAHDQGMRGSEAILWARVHSYLDPDTNRWNAPGLGNTTESITADQARRQQAVAAAIAATPMPEQAGASPDLESLAQALALW